MEYEKEIDCILREVFFRKNMSEEDYYEFEKKILCEYGITKEKLSSDIKKGVENGFSVERQIQLLKNIFYGINIKRLLLC